MSVSEDPGVVAATTRRLQIIVGVLLLSLVSFLVVILAVVPGPKPPAPPAAGEGGGPTEPLPVLTVMAYTFAVILLPLSLVVPKLLSDAQRSKIAAGKWSAAGQPDAPGPADDVSRLALVYQARKIIGAAMNEGAAFLALIASMIERNSVALGLSLALIICVALRFPRRAAVANWIDGQLELIRQERQSVKFQ
jgi:hypothetical protein